MPEFASVPMWIWWLFGGVLGALIVAAVVWFAYAGKAFSRRHLVGLISRQESIRASRRTFEAVMRHLADESDEALYEFASDPASEDRRSLQEVRDRMWVIADELDTRPVPRRLVAVAEDLADAAFVIGEQAGLIADDMEADEVLSALAKVDMLRVTSQMEEAKHRIDEACAELGVEDAAVYGGGLYI